MPWIRSGRAQIYFETKGGNGPPLVLIRGFASTIESWNGIAEDLARDHRIVLLDNRGVGRSSTPAGTYSVAVMADDVAAVLNATGIASAHVVGTSMGGMIAQELAIAHPGRVRSLVLAGTSCGGSHAFPLCTRGVLAIALAAALPPRLRARVSSFATLSPNARRTRPELIEHRAELLSASMTPVVGLVGQAFAVFRHATAPRLGRIRVPTLVIHGESDNLIDCRNADVLGRLIRCGRVELWPNVGHDLATEAPELMARRVRDHVRDTVYRPHLYRNPATSARPVRAARRAAVLGWPTPEPSALEAERWAEPA